MTAGPIRISILADAGQARREISGFGGAMESGFGRAKKALLGLGAGFAAFAVVNKVKDVLTASVAEAREAQKVTALTNAVIKSTGGAANVTAKQVGDLANAISRKTAIDDEAIQSAENLLLTFKDVRNEVGKGNDIFNQTTKTVVDMSAALNQDFKSSAIQVGKALNDPVKGLTALQRVGVTFNEEQKKTITHLVETGQKLKAQKIILKELRSEFGGAAKSQATAVDKMKIKWANLEEQIGTLLLPILDKLARYASRVVMPKLSRFVSQMQTGKGAGGRFVDMLGNLWDIAMDLKGPMQSVANATGDFLGYIATHRKALDAFVASLLVLKGISLAKSLGLGGLGKSVAGKVAGSAAPVPVFVTNWKMLGTPGTGTPATPTTVAKTVGKNPWILAAGSAIVFAAVSGEYVHLLRTKAIPALQRLSVGNVGGGDSSTWRNNGKGPGTMSIDQFLKWADTYERGYDTIRTHAQRYSRELEKAGPRAEVMRDKTIRALETINNKTTGLDSVQAHAAKASQNIELIGPHARTASGIASSAIRGVKNELAGIKDKRFRLDADTSQALTNVRLLRQEVDQLHGKTIIIRTTGGHVPGEPGSVQVTPPKTYNIHVTAPVGSDPYTIGESLRTYLNAYEQAAS